MKIRRAERKDSRRISYLIRTNTQKVVENKYTPEQIAVWKKVNSPMNIEKDLETKTIFCAFKNNRLLGTIGVKGNEVVGLYVSFSRRNMGIGGKLLAHLEAYAISQNIEELNLTSTISGLEFYKKKGYKAIKPVVVKILNVDFYETKMIKRLV